MRTTVKCVLPHFGALTPIPYFFAHLFRVALLLGAAVFCGLLSLYFSEDVVASLARAKKES